MIAGVDNKKREEFLFFTAYILWMTAEVLDLTMFRYFTVIEVACDYAQKVAYLLLVCLFFTKKRDKLKDALGIILILLCCVLANQSVHNLYIIPMAIFIYFASLDEFPQFWNALKGDRSLVGTRPPTVAEYEQYKPEQKIRLAFKPGLTGLWQTCGRSDIVDFDEVVKLGRKYIDEWSIGLDLRIILMTIKEMVKGRGAE